MTPRTSLAPKVAVLAILMTLATAFAVAQTTYDIGYGGGQPDAGDVADYIGFELLEASSAVDLIPLGSESAGISALVSGQLDIVNVDLVSAMKAVEQGLPLRVLIAANVKQEFVFVTTSAFPDLASLEGARVAFHAPGSTTEYYAYLVVEQLAGLDRNAVTWQAIQGSSNRVTALLSDRIDATVLEWADFLELQTQGDFVLLSSFNDIAPDATATVFVTTERWLSQNADAAQTFVNAMVDGYEIAANDKDAWLAKAAEVIPEVAQDTAGSTYDFYLDIGMFPVADTFSEDGWNRADAYYRSLGEYEDAAPYALVASEILDAAWSR